MPGRINHSHDLVPALEEAAQEVEGVGAEEHLGPDFLLALFFAGDEAHGVGVGGGEGEFLVSLRREIE